MTENAPDPAETPAAPPNQEAPETASPLPAPPKRKVLGALVLAGFAVTAVGGAWLWQQQQQIIAHIQQNPTSVDPARVATLESRIGTVQQRLAQLEQRPLPAAPPPVPPSPAPGPDLKPLEARLDQVAAKVNALQGAEAGAAQSLAGRLQALEQRVAQAEQQAQAVVAAAARTTRLQAAGVALEAGQPLGEIPGAPPALARFAVVNPPTEASLRLSFPAAADAAEQASEPSGAGLSLPARMWERVQTLVTVQQGNKVLIGPPSLQVLAQTRARLDAGDLAGTVATLDQLDAAAAKAMAGWRAQAQSLLDARAALAGMVRS
jgi:hypothetical protein